MDNDSSYRERQAECKRKWRREKPVHEYQKHYREAHPQYVESNRLKQKERNSKSAGKIVKIDSLNSEPLKTGIYQMRILEPNASEKIVKIDSLLIQLQRYQGIGSISP